jgi:hypothetical protein
MSAPAIADRTVEANAGWKQLEAALLECDPSQALIPQLRSQVDEDALSTFCAIGGLAWWRQGSALSLATLRAEFLERFVELHREPPKELPTARAPVVERHPTRADPRPDSRHVAPHPFPTRDFAAARDRYLGERS